MATRLSDLEKMQREIAQLKKRVERLERKKTTQTKTTRRKNGANGHAKAAMSREVRPRVRSAKPAIPRDSKIWEFIGSFDLGHPIGTDNEQIDLDLAAEYGATHAEE